KPNKEVCIICFDDIDSDLMLSVDQCGHRFCLNCVKHHIESKLLDGTIPNCPQHRCKSQLTIERCGKLLTLKMSLMWKQRIKEDLTPFTERVYCPYPRCSYLMSKTELSSSCESVGFRTCFKCNGSFCIHCKVPWHSMLSCTDYKKSRRLNDDGELIEILAKKLQWRQCVKCQQMIQRSDGCGRITCRCGHVFCYDCGADWYGLFHKGCYSRLEHRISV
ncbi:unnamed protein product, partial [Thlaspi arvense]